MVTRGSSGEEDAGRSPAPTVPQHDELELPWWIESPYLGLWVLLLVVIGTILRALLG